MFVKKSGAIQGIVNDIQLTEFAEQLPVGLYMAYTPTGTDISVVGQPINNVGFSYLIYKVASNVIFIIATRISDAKEDAMYIKKFYNTKVWSDWYTIPMSSLGGGNILNMLTFFKGGGVNAKNTGKRKDAIARINRFKLERLATVSGTSTAGSSSVLRAAYRYCEGSGIAANKVRCNGGELFGYVCDCHNVIQSRCKNFKNNETVRSRVEDGVGDNSVTVNSIEEVAA